jgi:GT2 family glycosyltransferase
VSDVLEAVNIVIPTGNGLRFLPDCLASIGRQQCLDWRITVVDNGSTDGSAEYLRKAHPKVHLISLPENRGFSAAVNAGILSSACPFVFLLNNDTELSMSCLRRLLTAAQDLPEISFFAPRMLCFNNRSVLGRGRRCLSARRRGLPAWHDGAEQRCLQPAWAGVRSLRGRGPVPAQPLRQRRSF